MPDQAKTDHFSYQDMTNAASAIGDWGDYSEITQERGGGIPFNAPYDPDIQDQQHAARAKQQLMDPKNQHGRTEVQRLHAVGNSPAMQTGPNPYSKDEYWKTHPIADSMKMEGGKYGTNMSDIIAQGGETTAMRDARQSDSSSHVSDIKGYQDLIQDKMDNP